MSAADSEGAGGGGLGFGPASLERGAAWLTGSGPDADVVISSRVRLARNVAGVPFVNRASDSQRAELVDRLREAVGSAGFPESMTWVDLRRLGAVERALLVERHLISREFSRGDWPRGVALSASRERVSIMVNEEDHVRSQVIRGGLALAEAFEELDAIDDFLQSCVPMAFSERWGFLTACPTNVGTGARFSVMLHLPALKLTGEIDKVKRATHDMAMAVRGYMGEGSEAVGDFYQLSNQTTLGKSERMLLHELDREILPRLLEYERAARRALMERRRRLLEDQVFRAVGTLRYARLISPEEALSMLSAVRLGVLCGLVSDISLETVNQLILLSQPAHLQRLKGEEMDQQRRREARADLVRHRLSPGG